MNTIECLKKPKTESLDIYTNKKRDITDHFRKSKQKYEKYKNIKDTYYNHVICISYYQNKIKKFYKLISSHFM